MTPSPTRVVHVTTPGSRGTSIMPQAPRWTKCGFLRFLSQYSWRILQSEDWEYLANTSRGSCRGGGSSLFHPADLVRWTIRGDILGRRLSQAFGQHLAIGPKRVHLVIALLVCTLFNGSWATDAILSCFYCTYAPFGTDEGHLRSGQRTSGEGL